MRIPRILYDGLKRIEANQGTTKEIDMLVIDDLIECGLITPANKHELDYTFKITPRGRESLSDRPIEMKTYGRSPLNQFMVPPDDPNIKPL